MKLRVVITETSYGSVMVDVPEGATAAEVYNAAYDEYCNGNAYFGGADFDIENWEEQ